MNPDIGDALEFVIQQTKHERFRELVRDRPDEYIPTVLALAAHFRRPNDVYVSRPAFDRSRVPDRITLRCALNSWSGYGQIGEWMGKALEARGLPVGYMPSHVDERFLPLTPFVAERRRDPDPGDWVLQLELPQTPRLPDRPTVYFTMWETTGLSSKQVRNLNGAEAVIVPCRWNATHFRKAGVIRPIHVCPLGVSADDGYSEKPWPSGKPFTFGMAARMSHGGVRKGLNEGMAAFVKAFPKRADVALEVKVWPDCVAALKIPSDRRIKIITDPMRPHEMAEWYGGLHCYFVPSKGEGWGLHTLQAMACARPIIATKYSGTAEFFDFRYGWELEYEHAPADEFYKDSGGSWAPPLMPSMVSRLREAYGDLEACQAKGRDAAERARGFGWDRMGERLAHIFRAEGFPTPGMRFEPPAPVEIPRYDLNGMRPKWVERVNTCPYRHCLTGCQGSTCAAGKGDRWNQVSLDYCIACLKGEV